MCRFGAEGFVGSPDRVDALVWAVTTLMLNGQGTPRILAPGPKGFATEVFVFRGCGLFRRCSRFRSCVWFSVS